MQDGPQLPDLSTDTVHLSDQLHLHSEYLSLHSAGVKYLYIRYNPDEAFDGLPMPTGDTLNFYNFVMDSEALIYFIAAGWTCLTCIYSAAMLPCGWKGPLAAHIDFFITLISFCFQCGLGVMSAINTLLFEQNFMNLIA